MIDCRSYIRDYWHIILLKSSSNYYKSFFIKLLLLCIIISEMIVPFFCVNFVKFKILLGNITLTACSPRAVISGRGVRVSFTWAAVWKTPPLFYLSHKHPDTVVLFNVMHPVNQAARLRVARCFSKCSFSNAFGVL
jgi:hypothetical protein